MQFRALKLIMHALRIKLGICHFTLYGLYNHCHYYYEFTYYWINKLNKPKN